MARLEWATPEQRKYEIGVDRGVFYSTSGEGSVWNGLISVEEEIVGGSKEEYFYDGRKQLETVSGKNFQARLTAFTAPNRFRAVLGDVAIIPGFILTRQPKKRFGLSYRTMISGDAGYQIHIVYNAMAKTTSRGYNSLQESIEATNFSWQIDAVPPEATTHRPTAHYVLDSTKISAEALKSVEDILYGTATNLARLPSADELYDRISFWNPVVFDLMYAGLGVVPGVVYLTSGLGDLTRTRVPGMLRKLPDSRLVKTTTSGFSRLED